MNSSETWTIERLFSGRPQSLKLFQIIKKYIDSLGPVKISCTKTQVSFGTVTKFAWVWLPQMWTNNRPEECVTVTFDADHQIKAPQIAAAVEIRPGHWTHHVIIEKESDLDTTVKNWLETAYTQSQTRRRKRDIPSVKKQNQITADLIAPCGMNCAVCIGHLRENNRCPGCLSYPTIFHCQVCELRLCTKRKGNYCYDCPDFPCQRLEKLDKRYRTRYEMSEIENLEYIKSHGIDEFVKKQREKYQSDQGLLCVHDKKYY